MTQRHVEIDRECVNNSEFPSEEIGSSDFYRTCQILESFEPACVARSPSSRDSSRPQVTKQVMEFHCY